MNQTKQRNPNALNDFFSFKIMVFPAIVKFLYIVSILVYIYYMWKYFVCPANYHGTREPNGEHAVIFLITLLPAMFVLHMIFEFFVVLFSILDTLLEIRNELMHQSNNQAIQINTAQRTSAPAYSGQAGPYIANNQFSFENANHFFKQQSRFVQVIIVLVIVLILVWINAGLYLLFFNMIGM